jgi:DNA modification methylase
MGNPMETEGKTTSVLTKAEVTVVRLVDLEIGDRVRKNYHDLQGLWHSISTRGLISPIAVERTPNASKKFLLLAGGRRVAAHVFGKADSVLARVYPEELTELDRKEIELHENMYREDLGYAEQIQIKAEIHELNVARYGVSSGTEEGHSVSDTAKILKESHTNTAEDLKLAEAIKDNPELAKQKNKSVAKSMMKSLMRQAQHKAVATRMEASTSEGKIPHVKKALLDRYVIADFLEAGQQIPKDSFHLIEADPPYGKNLTKPRMDSMDSLEMSQYVEIPQKEYPAFIEQVVKECFRLLMDNSWALFWFAMDPWYQMVLETIRKAGFTCNGMPCIWYRDGSSSRSAHPSTFHPAAYDTFFYARKGSAVLNRMGRENVYRYKPVTGSKKIHPAEHPVELMQEIYEVHAPAHAKVLIPFAGSGNGCLAAHNLGMDPLAFDVSEHFKASYAARIDEGDIKGFKSYADEAA